MTLNFTKTEEMLVFEPGARFLMSRYISIEEARVRLCTSVLAVVEMRRGSTFAVV